ncbi:MAG: glycosyltransferase, partial [Schleiferiaceae bacterium]|nr:glycosyltransferase [Schleiferiaceae bacterium]
EAMANAKVVLGANVPGIEDQLQHHKNYLFHPDNVQALVESLQKVFNHDTATNKAIGEAFHQHAAQHYSIEREVAQHQQFYQKILRK